jgi:hypothetical protein
VCGERCYRRKNPLEHDATRKIEHPAEPCGGERHGAETPDHNGIGHAHRHLRKIGRSERCGEREGRM